RPDLVGQTVDGDWIGIESKGRTRGHDPQALARAKEQAGMLESVDGETPSLLIGMVTHFGDGQLQLIASDPPARDRRDRVRLPLSRTRLLHAYYRPFQTWLESEPQTRTIERNGVLDRIAPVVACDFPYVGLSCH